MVCYNLLAKENKMHSAPTKLIENIFRWFFVGINEGLWYIVRTNDQKVILSKGVTPTGTYKSVVSVLRFHIKFIYVILTKAYYYNSILNIGVFLQKYG